MSSNSGDNEKVTPKPKESEPAILTFSELPAIMPEIIRTDKERLREELLTFYRCLLFEWQETIDQTESELKKTHEGRLTLHARSSSAEMMRPLFKRLNRDQLDRDLLLALANIAACLQQRQYVKANDYYLKMAIGNAPWPIGVTAVGIHERSSRERIKSSQVAHVLNDEVSRKWIQTIKRFITHSQKIRPPSDPSQAMG